MTEQVGGVGAMFALVAATRRALRCCGNRRQRSKCSNPLVCKRSLTNRTHSRAHDRHVEHPHPCSARNPGSISRRLKGLRECCIPRLYAAASLKQLTRQHDGSASIRPYSAALCRGLIEAGRTPVRSHRSSGRVYSAALCRGLIEALRSASAHAATHREFDRIPRLYAAASLKLAQYPTPGVSTDSRPMLIVFRGSMPRPH